MSRRAYLLNCVLLLCLCGLAGAGCSVIGAVSHVFFPPRVDPLYVPAKAAPMLVMVENRQNPGMLVPEAEELGVYLCRELERREVAPLVPAAKLQELRDRDPKAIRRMSISEIGKAVGAQQVLYVDIVSLQASEVAGMPTTGAADFRVHIVDPGTGRTLWPTDTYGVRYETTASRDIESGRERGLRARLLQGSAVRIARLFYQWDPEEEEP